jgi:hypothetical protein
LPEQEPLKSKAYDEEGNFQVDCADYRICGDGDPDSLGRNELCMLVKA